MYWIDWLDESGSALIERASMDGSDRQVIVNTVRSRPYDLALDVEMGKIYIIDGYHDTISSMDLDGSNSQQLQLFPSSIVPFSLVYHDGVLYWTERRIRLISRLTVGDNEPRQLGNVSVMTRRPAGLVMISPDLQPDCELKLSAHPLSHSLPILHFSSFCPLSFSTLFPSFLTLPILYLIYVRSNVIEIHLLANVWRQCT